MRRFVWRLGYRFGDNNNMWLLLSWTLFFFSLIFNLIVFGFGYTPPEIEPEKESIFYSSDFEEKETVSWSLKFWNSAFMIWLWGWTSYLSWITTFFLFLAALISFIFLFDEISRVWRATEIMIRERRNRPVEGGAAPTRTGAPPSGASTSTGEAGGLRGPLSLKSYFILEFLMNLLFELGLTRR